jgi:predicted nucleic acid-binding protein
MILVDSSVLIGYFKDQKGVPYDKMDYIIDNDIPYGICNYVYQELLQGTKSTRDFDLLKEYLNTLPFYDIRNGKKSFENSALIYINCRKRGITIRSTIDLLIAEIVLENNLYLLHNDVDFVNISKVYANLKLY